MPNWSLDFLVQHPSLREQLAESRDEVMRGEPPIPFKQVQAEARLRRAGKAETRAEAEEHHDNRDGGPSAGTSSG